MAAQEIKPHEISGIPLFLARRPAPPAIRKKRAEAACGLSAHDAAALSIHNVAHFEPAAANSSNWCFNNGYGVIEAERRKVVPDRPTKSNSFIGGLDNAIAPDYGAAHLSKTSKYQA